MRREMMREQLPTDQNLAAGIFVGTVASLAGAAVWATISAFSGWDGFILALGLGYLVGLAVRLAGRGRDFVFGIVAALLTAFGCLMRNLFYETWLIAERTGEGFLEVLWSLDFVTAGELLVAPLLDAGFSAVVWGSYAIGVLNAFQTGRISSSKDKPDSPIS